MSFGGPSRISAPLPTHRSSTRSRPGRLSSPVSGIEAVAHRAVCTTPLQLNDKAPAIGVMTTRFISAAEMMCRVLGIPDYKFVAIGHPISSASQETLAEYARATVDQAW